jgi:hypothetical protein
VNIRVKVNRPQAGGYNIQVPIVTGESALDAASGEAAALFQD